MLSQPTPPEEATSVARLSCNKSCTIFYKSILLFLHSSIKVSLKNIPISAIFRFPLASFPSDGKVASLIDSPAPSATTITHVLLTFNLSIT